MIISSLKNDNISKKVSDKNYNNYFTAFTGNNDNTFQAFSTIYSKGIKNYAVQQIIKTPTLTGNTLNDAMNELEKIHFSQNDIKYMQSLGVDVKFNNGKEIADFIKKNKIKVEFDKMGSKAAHAQWVKANNKITINHKYKNTTNPLLIVAISEAICHEGGHAKDGDDISSIKEEFDCLALNTLANRYHQRAYPNLFKENSEADILKNGVNLYTELFFAPDQNKERLVNRIINKYGDLPLTSPNHDQITDSAVLYRLIRKKRSN